MLKSTDDTDGTDGTDGDDMVKDSAANGLLVDSSLFLV
jgi:hypothetical protein